MSWGWAFFFSICFTPIVGIMFTFWIGRYGHSKKRAPIDQSQIMRAILCGSAAICFFIEGYTKWPPSIIFDSYDNSYYYQQLKMAMS